MEWITLCVVQISVFEKIDNAWVSPDANIASTSKWHRTEFARSGMDKCKMTISEMSPNIEFIMSGHSQISLPAEDFAELQINGPDGRTFGFYFIDGDEASAFVAIVASTLSSIRTASMAKAQTPPLKRKSLSQFHDVNQAVERAMDSPDGNYHTAVAEQQSMLGRLGSSALEMFKSMGGSGAGSGHFSGSGAGSDRGSGSGKSPVGSHQRHASSESSTSSVDHSQQGVQSVFSRPAFLAQGHAESDGDDLANAAISPPSSVKHDMKVSYDLYNVRYVGLPPEWKAMNKSFGLTYEEAPKIKLSDYGARIPAVLEMLKRYFLEYNGKEVVGIFRLAAAKEEIDACKVRINTGCFNGTTDVNVVSNLIKIYFREMPKSLLNCVPEKSIHKVADTVLNVSAEGSFAPVVSEMESFEEPHRSLFHWLLDLMVRVLVLLRLYMLYRP